MLPTFRRTFEEWRGIARPLLARGLRAEEVDWESSWVPAPAEKQGLLADSCSTARISAAVAGGSATTAGDVRLSRSLIELLECISHYRHPGRWELMYRLAYRASTENPRLLDDEADRDVRHARSMERAVERECHKMHAFVRFRELPREDGVITWFAWFEPDHDILPRAAPFFANRFSNAAWTIATPDGAAVWESGGLRFIYAPLENQAPRHDAHEALWRTYYRNVCNVARINPRAMRREMPQRYWRNMPETAEIPTLMRDGLGRFAQRHSEVDDRELQTPLSIQRALAQLPSFDRGPSACRRCDLWRHATQAVLGFGPATASLLLVGEQPGDEEDLRGLPFVGPAGKLLDGALREAGLDRAELFITNAVKHFKWEPRKAPAAQAPQHHGGVGVQWLAGARNRQRTATCDRGVGGDGVARCCWIH